MQRMLTFFCGVSETVRWGFVHTIFWQLDPSHHISLILPHKRHSLPPPLSKMLLTLLASTKITKESILSCFLRLWIWDLVCFWHSMPTHKNSTYKGLGFLQKRFWHHWHFLKRKSNQHILSPHKKYSIFPLLASQNICHTKISRLQKGRLIRGLIIP